MATIQNPVDAFNLARTLTLGPAALQDQEQAIALAQRAVASDPKAANYKRVLGVALYRAGKFEKALDRLNEAIKLQHGKETAWNWYCLAMCYGAAGKNAEARQALAKGHAWVEAQAKGHTDVEELLWYDRVELELLRREAEKVVGR
jgi:Flp pilus assembly protein TadD